MPTCWCASCASQRRQLWPERAGRELARAEASGLRSWLVCLDPGPAAQAGAAYGELQLWLKRLRRLGASRLRYLATVVRRRGRLRLRVLLHAPAGLVPADLRAAWPRSVRVAPAAPADLVALLAPRCEHVVTRASVRYGPRPPRRFRRGERWHRLGPAGPATGEAAPAAAAPCVAPGREVIPSGSRTWP